MKQLFTVLFFSVFFVACQKESTPVEEKLQAQTLNNVSYGSDPAQKMDIYLPAGRTTTSTKAIIMIHGGGWVLGSKADMNQYIPTIQQRMPEYAIFNIGYRLGAMPATNAFPTQENDVKAATKFITSKASEYKFNTGKVVILGASAGGHLALLQAYKQASPKVKAVVSLFGPTDMVALHDAYPSNSFELQAIRLLMSGTPATNAALYASSSPINYVTAQSPPTLILHGTADDVVPYAQSTALKAKLETAGASVTMVTYPNAGHGDWNPATFNDAYTQIVNFLAAKNQ